MWPHLPGRQIAFPRAHTSDQAHSAQAGRRDTEAGFTGPASERAGRKRRWPEGQVLRKLSWLQVWNPLNGGGVRDPQERYFSAPTWAQRRGAGHNTEVWSPQGKAGLQSHVTAKQDCAWRKWCCALLLHRH